MENVYQFEFWENDPVASPPSIFKTMNENAPKISVQY
jgi:hypothetical protein